MIFNLYKNRGETPLECLERFRATRQELEKASMTYLGRLDPLAEGVLLVGSAENAQQEEREKFFGLDKEYDFTAIFGFETDSYDVMGRVLKTEKPENLQDIDLIKVCKIYEGEREQRYPKYSSKMISSLNTLNKNQEKKTPREQLSDRDWRENEGIFQPRRLQSGSRPGASAQKNTPVAREDVFSPDLQNEFSSLGSEELELPKLSSESFPSKMVTVHNLKFQKLENISSKDLFARILMDVSRVKGDFRQGEILEDWNKLLLESGNFEIPIANFSAHVSSGTYIRSLVNSIGETLGCGATTLSIKRTRVGEYKIEDSIRF